MTIEESCETALINALKTAGVHTAHGATLRGFLVDDDTGEAEEKVALPAIAVQSGVAVPEDDREGPCMAVPVTVQCVTYFNDDKKRAALKALYESVRAVIDAEVFTMPSGSFDALIVEDGSMSADAEVNMIETVARFYVRTT